MVARANTKIFAAKRSALTDQLADLVLAAGLNDLGLRPAAMRLGTSDRMLLYYFATKADLIAAVLARMSDRMAKLLELSPAKTRTKPDALLAHTWALYQERRIVPYMRVWAEVASRGARGEEPYRRIAHQTIAYWLIWIEERLDMPVGGKRKQTAAAILTILEGAILLEMSNPGSTQGVRALLARALRDL